MESRSLLLSTLLVSGGFLAGMVTSSLASAPDAASATTPPSEREFLVAMYEVKQRFAFAERFKGTYAKEITLSDGSVRKIALTPQIKNGELLVRFDDGNSHTFMGPDGMTVNGKLLVQLVDFDRAQAEHRGSKRN